MPFQFRMVLITESKSSRILISTHMPLDILHIHNLHILSSLITCYSWKLTFCLDAVLDVHTRTRNQMKPPRTTLNKLEPPEASWNRQQTDTKKLKICRRILSVQYHLPTEYNLADGYYQKSSIVDVCKAVLDLTLVYIYFK